MLEQLRRELVKAIHDNIAGATVIRDFELVPYKSPEIGVKFESNLTPAYTFLGDVHDASKPYGGMRLYEEPVYIRVTSNVPHQGGVNDARVTVDSLVESVKQVIRYKWPSILGGYGAGFMLHGNIVISNTSFTVNNQRFVSRTVRVSLLVPDAYEPTEPPVLVAPEKITFEVKLA